MEYDRNKIAYYQALSMVIAFMSLVGVFALFGFIAGIIALQAVVFSGFAGWLIATGSWVDKSEGEVE